MPGRGSPGGLMMQQAIGVAYLLKPMRHGALVTAAKSCSAASMKLTTIVFIPRKAIVVRRDDADRRAGFSELRCMHSEIERYRAIVGVTGNDPAGLPQQGRGLAPPAKRMSKPTGKGATGRSGPRRGTTYACTTLSCTSGLKPP